VRWKGSLERARTNELHQARGFLLCHEGNARGLERRIPKGVVAVKMAVDDPSDRLVGHLTDAIDQILAEVRMFAGVDHQYAIVGDQKNRVGTGVVKEK